MKRWNRPYLLLPLLVAASGAGCKGPPRPRAAAARTDSATAPVAIASPTVGGEARGAPPNIDDRIARPRDQHHSSASTTGSLPSATPTGRNSSAPPPASPAIASAPDTARGRVAVVGATPFTRVELRPAGGGRGVVLTGTLAGEIRALSGADVWVAGTRDAGGRLEVARYEVRSVDGVPAVDGLLVADGERLYLETADGRRRAIANPPAALRAHVGARVWLSGDLSGTIAAFGIIRPRQ